MMASGFVKELAEMSPALRSEAALHVNGDHIYRIPWLAKCSRGFIASIALEMQLHLYCPSEYVPRAPSCSLVLPRAPLCNVLPSPCSSRAAPCAWLLPPSPCSSRTSSSL